LKALITGDSGFIGRNMKQYLEMLGIQTLGFSRRDGYDVLDGDKLLNAARICDLVYHFAAEAKPGESVLEPAKTMNINIKGSTNVLEVCRILDRPLVYPSSCEIYGDSETSIDEDHPLQPPNPYAASKAAIDRVCYAYHKCYHLDVKIVRLFNPYGPEQQLNKVIPTFYFQARRKKPITVYGDGSDTRDYVYIDDIVNGLWLARNLPSGEAINLATGRATSNLKLANLIIELTGSSSRVVFTDYPKAFGGIKSQVGSWKKANKMLGWEPRTSLLEGVSKTIKWLEETIGDDMGRE